MPPAMLAPCSATPRPGGMGRGQSRPGHHRRRLMHAGEHRVVSGGQPERPRVAELGRLQTAGTKVLGPAADRPHRRDIPGLMHKLQVCVGGQGRGGHGHTGLIPQSELVREPHRQLQPHRCQRMARPEVIVSQPLVPGHMQGAGHLPHPLCPTGAARGGGPGDPGRCAARWPLRGGIHAGPFGQLVEAVTNLLNWAAERGRARDKPRAYSGLIGEAVWWVTIVDGTLVRHHLKAYDGIGNPGSTRAPAGPGNLGGGCAMPSARCGLPADLRQVRGGLGPA